MKIGKNAKQILDFILFLKLKLFFFLLTPCSIHFLNKLADIIGCLCYFILFPRRQTALCNLDKAFGDLKTKNEKKKIAIKSFQNFVRGVLEMRYFYCRGTAEINRRFEYSGLENYTEALKKGPVLFISGHIGQFPLMVCKFILDKFDMHLILKAVSNKYVENMFNVYRQRLAKPDNIFKTIIYYKPRFIALKRSLKELKSGHSLFIFVDQRFSNGIMTKFFGRDVLTATGADTLARKTSATVLPAFIIRKGAKHVINIGKAIPIGSDESENTQKFTDQIEKNIRNYPGQWWWFHRRWR
ncbi:MAG: hypothetical protein ABII20_07050 [Candidatus Omnitrophota bacterium]|nr:hypothetical protein [Candidatus Omnitrophota bacterium]